MRLTVVPIALLLSASALTAQDEPLQVLRHTPTDSATPGNLVTVTFDRPVAGRLGETLDPARIFRIEPAIPGQLRWRDPITLRFVPDDPMPPGARYTVTIDTGFRAIDGSRLASPYRFTFRVPGAVVLARGFDYHNSSRIATIPVNGRLRFLYSAPVPDTLFARARLELSDCEPRMIRLRLATQRPLTQGDPYTFLYAGSHGDTSANRFRRVVELAPETELPNDCTGRLILPNTADDSVHGAEESFGAVTAARFRLVDFACAERRRCTTENLEITFTAPVKREDVMRFVRVTPAEPLAYDEYPAENWRWVAKVALRPRTRYTLTVSDSLRDIHGRRLEGPRALHYTTADYTPEIAWPRGHLTIARSGMLTLPLRHLNVRTVRVISVPIREGMRSIILERTPWSEISQMRLRADTTIIELDAAFNTPGTTQLRLPASAVRAAPGLVALRVEIAEELRAPDGRANPMEVQVRAARINDQAFDFALLQLTDLALHAKLAPGDGRVLVTSLVTGRHVPNVRVHQEAHNGVVVARGVTDSAGIATLNLPSGEPVVPGPATRPISSDWPPRVGLLVARHGTDRAVLPLSLRRMGYEPTRPIEISALGAWQGDVPAASGALLTDRDIYRPGEMLYLKGIVRYGILGALQPPPAGDSVRVRVAYTSQPDWYRGYDEDGRYDVPHDDDSSDEARVRDTVLRVSDLGTVADSLRLRSGTKLGSYIATLQSMVAGRWRTIAAQRVRVAEYRAPEFLIDASADSGIQFAGDTLRVRVNGRYLFGAPMGRASVTWTATIEEAKPWEVKIPGAEGWTVGEWDWWSGGPENPETRLEGTDSLDSGGRVTLRVPLTGLTATRPGRVSVEVAVTDINRQAVGAGTTSLFHASDVYILARRKGNVWPWISGQRATVEMRAVRPDGSTLRGVPITVAVVRREWIPNGGDGNPWKDEPIASDTILSRDSAASYAVIPRRSGWYEVRLSAPNGRGGVARTTLGAYVAGTGGYAWWSGSPLQLQLMVDRGELLAGSETSIAFDSPFDSADAWLTVERERVLEQRQFPVRRGSNVVRLQLAEKHIPNVYVSVMLRRRSPGMSRPDSAAQVLRIGYAELRVKSAPKRLAIAIHPERTEYRPGDTAVMKLRVSDAAGRGTRAEVTVWAVDQGVLALTGFTTPDLLARMYRPRGVGAGFWSSLPSLVTSDPGRLMTRLRGTAGALSSMVIPVSMGEVVVTGAQEGPEASMRTRFRPTAFYLASARTDASGSATVRAALPDNLTTFRVMAVVVDDGDRFGSGDTTLLVTRSLVARPALPRFVRAADTLHAGAAINARDGLPRPVTVHAQGNGLLLVSPARADVQLAAGRGVDARFDWVVPSRDSVRDSVVVQLRAADGVHADAVETRLPVRPDFHPRAHTRMGMLRDAADVVVELPADIDAARSTVSIRLGTSPLAPMLAAYERLRVYPYHCTEQIASGGRALVAIWRATRDQSPDALGGDPRPRLQQLADEIARRQAPNGAVRYWDDHEWTTPWLSAYAGLFLLEARDAGVIVSDATLKNLSGFLTRSVATRPDTGGANRFERRDRRLALGGRVAIVDYLRRAGTPSVDAEDQLLALAPMMTWEDRLRLAEVIAARPDARAQGLALVDAAWRAVATAGRRVDLPDSAHAEREFPSRIAPAARLLTAALALTPEHPWIGGLVETVLQHGRAEGRWAWSTQDYASVVLGLASLPPAGDAERVVRVSARGRPILTRGARSSSAGDSVPLAGLLERGRDGRTVLRLRLASDRGATPLYFAATVSEVPGRPPVTPDIQGIVVERWYERFDNGEPVTAVREGDLVRVRLRVTVPSDRQFVAVEDPLPAGLEPLDISLRTTALDPFVTPGSERARMMSERGDRGAGWQSWLYGSWDGGWWSPWEHRALHDDRVVYFARMLWAGSYTATYVARATTVGSFVRPPAHAEEMYNPALRGRSDGGRFQVIKTVR